MAGVRGGIFGEAGRWPPQELARFVVLAGAAGEATERLLADAPEAHPAPEPALTSPASAWWRIDLDQAAALGASLASEPDVARFRERLRSAWSRVDSPPPAGARLSGGPPDLDIAWLTRLLVQEVPLAAAVIDTHRPDVAALDWPLRIGVIDSAEGRDLQQRLEGGWYRDLYTPVIATQQEAMDLLLLPGNLSEALERQDLLEASVVLVLGPADVGPDRLNGALHGLSERHRAAVVAVVDGPVDGWPTLLFELVAELSHNVPWPLALCRAAARRPAHGHAAPADPPVVLADLAFADSNRPIDTAARLAEQLRDGWPGAPLSLDPGLRDQLAIAGQPPQAETVAAAVEATVLRWPWDMETQGASHLARLRRAIDAELGPLDLRRRPWSREAWAMAAPPEMASPEPEPSSAFEVIPAQPHTTPARHVKFNLLPADPSAAPPAQPRLSPHSEHRLLVFIAPLDHQAHGTADAPLDERPLDARPEGHWLTVVYCPLPAGQDGDGAAGIPPPVTAPLHLPRQGPTGTVEFLLRAGAQPSGFRARLIVLHENRVLQTLLLTGQPDGGLSLSVENRYAPGFESPSADAPADLSFVINDNPEGVSGLTTVAPHRASFLAPDGLKESIAQMRKILNGAVQAEAGNHRLRLDRPELLDLMRQLANHGAVIVEELAMQHPLQTLEDARRVQVVEAVDQAYFPVEFLYSGPAPEPGAVLCPNASAALAAGGDALHTGCPHRNDEGHVCPLSFWGFRKCIERHAPNGDPTFTVSVPTPGQERLGPFGSALLAASDRAREEMEGPQGLPAALARTMSDVTTVTTWADWKAQLLSRPRDVLVLMPHSDKSATFPGIPALEVSTDELAASNLSEKYVHSGAAHGPLVLLLGCSTSFADLPFLNFVRRFHLKGAPVVVGTLSVVHATQARHLAQRLLDSALSPDGQGLRLDEALLKVRRELLAEGNGVSFTLMAYGHSTWRL